MSDKLNGYVTFPYAAQVACVEREIVHVRKHKTTLERVYLITSQNRTEACPLFAKHSIHDAKESRLQPYIRTFDETRVSVPDGICQTAPHHFIALTVLWTPQVSPFVVRPHCHHVMIA